MPRRRAIWWRVWRGIFRVRMKPCPIGSDRALDAALITAPEARDRELLKKLDAVAGRVLRQ